MRVVMARAMGSCSGVQRALAMALAHERPEDLTILGQLVHNPQTVRLLEGRGIRAVAGVAELDAIVTPDVMVTAHGASDRVKAEVVRRGKRLVDATCPLVQRVHDAAKRLVREGFFPVVIGEERHVEVQGIVGDLAEHLVIKEAAQVDGVPPERRRRLGIVSQTTQNAQRVEEIAAEVRTRPGVEEVRLHNTVCRPTRERQEAVEELCREVGLVVVVGGRNSSNTRQLARLCESRGVRALLVESAAELRPEDVTGLDAVGVTAGTSTPEAVIEQVRQRLLALAGEG